MASVHVTDLSDERLDVFMRLTDHQLRSDVEQGQSLMVVESPFALEVALRTGAQPVAFLLDERHAAQMAPLLETVPSEVPIFLATREQMTQVVGFRVTRGVMGAFRRPEPRGLDEVIAGARRIAVFEGLVDVSNVGAAFRSAAAFGVDAVLLDATCADPLARRSIRVSMGTVLQVPWARLSAEGECGWPQPVIGRLQEEGFYVLALALEEDALPLDDPSIAAHDRIALVFGSEGWGISRQALDACDVAAIIPMAPGVDSLNVAAASAVTFWELRVR